MRSLLPSPHQKSGFLLLFSGEVCYDLVNSYLVGSLCVYVHAHVCICHIHTITLAQSLSIVLLCLKKVYSQRSICLACIASSRSARHTQSELVSKKKINILLKTSQESELDENQVLQLWNSPVYLSECIPLKASVVG